MAIELVLEQILKSFVRCGRSVGSKASAQVQKQQKEPKGQSVRGQKKESRGGHGVSVILIHFD
jgi:hypothetical protein